MRTPSWARGARRNDNPRRSAHEDKTSQRQAKWPYKKSNTQTSPWALQLVGVTLPFWQESSVLP